MFTADSLNLVVGPYISSDRFRQKYPKENFEKGHEYNGVGRHTVESVFAAIPLWKILYRQNERQNVGSYLL